MVGWLIINYHVNKKSGSLSVVLGESESWLSQLKMFITGLNRAYVHDRDCRQRDVKKEHFTIRNKSKRKTNELLETICTTVVRL